MRALAMTALLAAASPGLADDANFSGKWLLDVRVPAEPLSGLLELEQSEGAWLAWVEGGPAQVAIDGERIELLVDSRDRQGYLFQRKLSGVLRDGAIGGTLASLDVAESAAEFGEDGSTWTARRYVALPPPQPIRALSDLAGTWVPLRGVDFRKYTMALTPAAEEWHAGYDARMDEPQKRCISPGLYAAVTWSFPFEIVASDGKLVMLYEAFNLSRRIFTDRG